MTEYIFWIALGVLFYGYVGYCLLIMVINSVRKLFCHIGRSFDAGSVLPEVTLVVAAYNEESVIVEKINNCFELDYPEDKLSMIFVTDGCDDNTAKIVGLYPRIILLNKSERRGKSAALNHAREHVHSPITIFCDANTMLNPLAIKNIVRRYQDPNIGGVAGEKRIGTRVGDHSSVISEGVYWKYESLLKRMDSDLYSVIGAAGELFSVRTALWTSLPEQAILDDFIISIRINLQGYRICYEPEAWAIELPSISLKEEGKRKVRICAGAFQALTIVKPIFNIFRYPVLSFQFISHRLLRWTLIPLCFPVLIFSNIVLAYSGGSVLYLIMLAFQCFFYAMVLCGALANSKAHMPTLVKVCHYIFFMNYNVYLGFIRFVRNGQSPIWDKVSRTNLVKVG